MTFADAIQNLRDGYATKRPSWKGYVKKTNVDEEAGTHDITFKDRAGTTFSYKFDGTKYIDFGSPGILDPDLMTAMVSDDWTIGTVAAFEEAASGSGTW